MSDTLDPLTTRANGVSQLDELLQHRARLGACALLATADSLTFARLKELLSETDGNLGANLRKLEDAGYISAEKAFVLRKPVTSYSLSKLGRGKLTTHLAALRAVIGEG